MTTRRLYSITLLILCQVLAVTLWFSASSAAATLIEAGAITRREAGLLTGAVQLGFVAGTLVSAWYGLADRIDPRRLFAAAAATGALANLLILWSGFDGAATLLLRFVTGAALAGIYPVGMKLAAGWAQRGVGLLIGTLVGAVTVGSALPHLVIALSGLDWRVTICASSAAAGLAAVLILTVGLGPRHATSARFVPGEALTALRRPALLLANAGYLGHMFELYAMWAWIGVFLGWGLAEAGWGAGEGGRAIPSASLLTFLVIASGGIGCVVAGAAADRIGRTTVTMAAMTVSGLCAATIGFTPALGPAVLIALAIVWGVTIVADSAQFSAAIAELAEPRLVGTMLTLQTSLGFLLTFATIQAMPFLIETLTWRYAFMILAIGPALGTLAMWRLRREPESLKIAGGRR
ncbi:MFS transporter [Acuticoccus sp. I52.16.1]|uniref:MFS transporter n=1 Tax=Acuticoccus sp. I52.16.1 TaxID=2928472 RepID=UPI001FD52EC6|nr:MFS transporter [Acuticoccus sp. I52.16.1]UOM37314.1 MFS transporter [Acuticoccus sp. I52.16.1]